MSEQTKYPLSWPDGWPRTAPVARTHSRFIRPSGGLSGNASRYHSMDEAFRALKIEMGRLGVESWILSSNVPRRVTDGAPYSNTRMQPDPGVAIYFKLDGKDLSLACDKWLRVECNAWALAKHIEALRGTDRWGVGRIEQAFGGYTALPGIGQSGGIKWWEILGVPVNASAEQVKEAYRILAKKHHPDRGGDRELWDRLQEAYEHFSHIQQ